MHVGMRAVVLARERLRVRCGCDVLLVPRFGEWGWVGGRRRRFLGACPRRCGK